MKYKLLIVCSANSGKVAPFIEEQVMALQELGIDTDYFLVQKKGLLGYLNERKRLLLKIKQFQPDLIHAHYGLSGLLANMQVKVPVVTTYHGCDINRFFLRILSYIPLLFSKYNIFVSNAQVRKVRFVLGKYAVIPCGVDFKIFQPMSKSEARKILGWNMDTNYILFSSSFKRPEKNVSLAKAALSYLPGDNILVELNEFSRREVMLAMNACDVGLLTSIREGSPMFIKEMMACNRPIVSTNVGDVSEQLYAVSGCYIVAFSPKDVADAILESMKYDCIQVDKNKYDIINNDYIAQQLIGIYQKILNP